MAWIEPDGALWAGLTLESTKPRQRSTELLRQGRGVPEGISRKWDSIPALSASQRVPAEATGVATLFTRIISGELPGRFVWKDDTCVAFLSIAPLKPGHTLVVSREEKDHWLELSSETAQHLTHVSHCIGKAIQAVWNPEKVGTMILGLEVPHVHIHLLPIWGPRDLDFDNADANAKAEDLDEAAALLVAELQKQGHAEARSLS